MRTAVLSVLAVLVAACAGNAAEPDASLPESCDAIVGDFERAVAEPGARSCTSDADCTAVGGTQELPTCNCVSTLGDCSGEPISRTSAAYARAQDAATRFFAQCAGTHELCDCAPSFDLRCVNGGCGYEVHNTCFPPDARP